MDGGPAVGSGHRRLHARPSSSIRTWPRPSSFVPRPGDAGSTTRGPSPTSPRPPAAPPPIRNPTGPLPGSWPPAPSASSRDGPRAVQEGTAACELTHWKTPVPRRPGRRLCGGRRFRRPPSSGKPAPWSCCPAMTRTKPSTAAACSSTRRRSLIGISRGSRLKISRCLRILVSTRETHGLDSIDECPCAAILLQRKGNTMRRASRVLRGGYG